MSHVEPMLFFVRHGESGWNEAGLLQGQAADAPGLTATGRHQAAEAAAELSGSGATLLIVSDLLRTVETATPIATALGIEMRIDPRLRERSLGIVQGHPIATHSVDLGVKDGIVTDADAFPQGGESTRELYDRVARFVNFLRFEAARRIVLVTHGGVVRVARGYFGGQGPEGLAWDAVGSAKVWAVSPELVWARVDSSTTNSELGTPR